MQSTPTRDLVRACLIGYTLWVFVHMVASMILYGRTPADLLYVPLSVFCFFLVSFVILALVALFFLFTFYRMVGACRLRSRMQGELIYVLASGFISVNLLVFCGGTGPWWGLVTGWVFFSLPTLFTVLALRGMEWYRRRKWGRGEQPAR